MFTNLAIERGPHIVLFLEGAAWMSKIGVAKSVTLSGNYSDTLGDTPF